MKVGWTLESKLTVTFKMTQHVVELTLLVVHDIIMTLFISIGKFKFVLNVALVLRESLHNLNFWIFIYFFKTLIMLIRFNKGIVSCERLNFRVA